ncbi:MAG: 2-oxoglutarate dehydrogenase complex dihydrolipoyllysine-residue succinyltransferase [Bacillota bacterium]
MAIQVEVPALGESVTQAILVSWHKADGETVAIDEPICELETDKANVDIPAKSAGILHRLKEEGETVHVGDVIARIDESPAVSTKEPATPPATAVTIAAKPKSPAAAPAAPAATTVDELSPAVRRLVEENRLDAKAIPATGPGGRLTKEDVERYLESKREQAGVQPSPEPSSEELGEGRVRLGPSGRREAAEGEKWQTGMAAPLPAPEAPAAPVRPAAGGMGGERRVPMSRLRKRIAERLVQAQHTAAILTTFNEVDLTEVISLRGRFKERFQEVHGVGLGFMSFFARATVLALKEIPQINAFLEGDDLVYHDYVNLGIAVSTERGLAVPVLRNVQDMSFARIEAEIKRLAAAARDGKLAIDELSGGTFTITNGGVFGSLLSTPILTPPQSGILGMHTIQKRPIVINDKIEVRSMMYVALSYDHRIVDGREAITFLVRLKQMLEEPARLILEI